MIFHSFSILSNLFFQSEDNIIEATNSISVIDLLLQSGLAGQCILLILLVLSIITVYLFFE